MILAAVSQIQDGRGNLDETRETMQRIAASGLRTSEIRLAPARMGWRDALPVGYERGAAAPIRAIVEARGRLASGDLDCLIVRGEDAIRSEFASNKQERERLMVGYSTGDTFLTAYTRLTHVFMKRFGVSSSEIAALSTALFENYLRTWRREEPGAPAPADKWFEPVSDVLRGVDCANPVVDYAGCLILMTTTAADVCDISRAQRVRVVGAAIETACPDEIPNIARVAAYDHLESAIRRATKEAGVDFAKEFLASNCLLEAYTCYPVVPLAFLLKSGLVARMDHVDALLARHEITVTGGLNLARAPGNNTTLRACVRMVELLRRGGAAYGAVHGNSGFGYEQAFLLLSSAAERS
jgi:hypothetical protein